MHQTRTPRPLKKQPSREQQRDTAFTDKLIAEQELQYRVAYLKREIDSLLDHYTTDKDKQLKELVNELNALQIK